MQKRILMILTGGTICSFANEQGEQESDTKKAQTLIVENFRKGNCEYRSEECVEFVPVSPLDILSENMTVDHWNILIEELKKHDFSKYDGVIILHGTDTLAYTSSLLSILLAGTPIPVFMISSQLPLYNDEANGNANFKAAVELIVNGIQPNIYVVYRNEELENNEIKKTMYIHYASHLLQCQNYSNNFYSCDKKKISEENAVFKGKRTRNIQMPLYDCDRLLNCVLEITPYVGIDYNRFSLDGVKAVLHHTYHSGTVASNPHTAINNILDEKNASYTQYSIMSLKKRCDSSDEKIDLYIEPCHREKAYSYETTGMVLRSGAFTSWCTTSEMAYVKLVIGCSMGYKGKKLQQYINKQINGEFVRKPTNRQNTIW